MPRSARQFELVVTDRNQLASEVMAKLERLKAARPAAATSDAGGEQQTALVDVHPSDFDHAQDLLRHLSSRNIAWAMTSGQASPSGALSAFEASLANVGLYIVVFGGVAREWVDNRLSAAIQRGAAQGAREGYLPSRAGRGWVARSRVTAVLKDERAEQAVPVRRPDEIVTAATEDEERSRAALHQHGDAGLERPRREHLDGVSRALAAVRARGPIHGAASESRTCRDRHPGWNRPRDVSNVLEAQEGGRRARSVGM